VTARSEVAAGIGATVDDVAIYDYVPDVLRLPAVVVAPSNPYIVQDTACARVWALEVSCLLVPTDDRSGPGEVEVLVGRVLDALETIPGVTWSEVSPPAPVEIGGQSMLAATITTKAWRA
jgi:hypothetical protein